MSLGVVSGKRPGESMRLISEGEIDERESLERAFRLARAGLAELTRDAGRLFDAGAPLFVCQDPVEDALAAIDRARASLEVEG
jgi:hypothetical protein